MSYQQYDTSVNDSAPIECYKFIGPTGEYRYTDNAEPVTVGGEVYTPLPITRTAFDISSVVDTQMTMDFNIPATSELAQIYCFKTTPEMMTVEVRSVHRGDDWGLNWRMEWIGFSLDTSVSGNWATIRTGSVIQSKLKVNIASIVYQRLCNHVLFDARCKVNRANWTLTADVTRVQGQLITVDNDGTGDGELTSGEIVVVRTGERRSIYSNNDNIITISYPFVDIENGDSVELVFGCDHKRLGHCRTRFNNVENYGGFDFIPVENPFTDLHVDSKVTETIKEKSARVRGGQWTSIG